MRGVTPLETECIDSTDEVENWFLYCIGSRSGLVLLSVGLSL